jgi:hypothetical protein
LARQHCASVIVVPCVRIPTSTLIHVDGTVLGPVSTSLKGHRCGCFWTRFSGVERRMIMPCRAGAAGTLYRNTSGGVGRYLAEASANGHSSNGYPPDTLLHSEACYYTGDVSLLNFQQAIITCHGRHMSACLEKTSESLIGSTTVLQQVPRLNLSHESGSFKHSYVAWHGVFEEFH